MSRCYSVNAMSKGLQADSCRHIGFVSHGVPIRTLHRNLSLTLLRLESVTGQLGVVATLMLQFAAAFRPEDTHLRGPDSFTPFQYVDDGAFVEPWLATRPWLSVTLWETGLTHRFILQAAHQKKKEMEGKCHHRIIL